MSRWGKPTKNKKGINARYFLNEQQEADPAQQQADPAQQQADPVNTFDQQVYGPLWNLMPDLPWVDMPFPGGERTYIPAGHEGEFSPRQAVERFHELNPEGFNYELMFFDDSRYGDKDWTSGATRGESPAQDLYDDMVRGYYGSRKELEGLGLKGAKTTSVSGAKRDLYERRHVPAPVGDGYYGSYGSLNKIIKQEFISLLGEASKRNGPSAKAGKMDRTDIANQVKDLGAPQKKNKNTKGHGPNTKAGKIDRADIANQATDMGAKKNRGKKNQEHGPNTKAGKFERSDVANKATGRWVSEQVEPTSDEIVEAIMQIINENGPGFRCPDDNMPGESMMDCMARLSAASESEPVRPDAPAHCADRPGGCIHIDDVPAGGGYRSAIIPTQVGNRVEFHQRVPKGQTSPMVWGLSSTDPSQNYYDGYQPPPGGHPVHNRPPGGASAPPRRDLYESQTGPSKKMKESQDPFKRMRDVALKPYGTHRK